MMQATEQLDIYQRDFEAFRKRRSGQQASWLEPSRERALARFREVGFPTTRDEAWRFTSLKELSKTAFHLAGESENSVGIDSLEPYLLQGECAALLVFVNGQYCQRLSHCHGLPPGARFTPMAEALKLDRLEQHKASFFDAEGDGVSALNAAFFEDGVFLELSPDIRVTHPIQMMFLTLSGADEPEGRPVAHPRNLILAGAGSEVTLVENHISLGEDAFWTNQNTAFELAPNARVTRYFMENQNQSGYHTAKVSIHQQRDSSFEAHHFQIGGKLSRCEMRVTLDGPGAEVLINGLFMGRGHQHQDNFIVIDHARPHCSSRQFVKGILDDRSRGVFHGRVVVREDAQKTDAAQTNRNLLLSPDARIDTKPQLEIYADDVKCAHGATTGQLDPDAYFYLLARGIDPGDAYDLLVYAFAHEVIDRMPLDAFRSQAEHFLFQRFSRARLIDGTGF